MVHLISSGFSSPKLICFEEKINEYFNESNFLHFLLLFPISRQQDNSTIERDIFRGDPFIHPFLLLRN